MPEQSDTIKHVTYSCAQPGPKLLVLGAVHGNETCGPLAIARVLAELDGGALELARGQVTFVPVCNPEAHRRGVRFVERNLNRFLVPHENPDTYEARLGNMLCPLLECCDVLLDLHSFHSDGEPFAFLGEDNEATRAFAASLGPVKLMAGWNEAYAASGGNAPGHPDRSIGTVEYAARCGAVAALLECGGHTDPDAPEIAHRAIHNALRYLKLIDLKNADETPAATVVTVKSVIYRQREGALARQWKNFDPVQGGETIATYDDGEALTAPGNGLVIIPYPECPVGQEWYYWGTLQQSS